MKFSIKNFFSKQDLVTFTEEILDEKLHLFCSECTFSTKLCSQKENWNKDVRDETFHLNF